ncbi:hypothetical protein WNY37_17630 [Henriciella sp. AS95]|uniref:hypothetical protein n=1 Tax=Henriciella sp. AS95 TaxID=3135782 RepID=UPI00316FB8C7
MDKIKTWSPHVIAVIASLVFLDSLRFKFTNAPETIEIFTRLDNWAASFGAGGLFAQTGLFSQYVIGTAELFAAALLLLGIHPALRRLQALGAVIAFAVMSGAVNFHLWTPLGIDPNNDGGGLFFMACVVLATSIVLILIRRKELAAIGRGLVATFLPGRAGTRQPHPTPRASHA